MSTAMSTTPWLRIDPEATAEKITSAITTIVLSKLRRKGVVLGLSGGVDSSVVAALCVRALGNQRVLALLMPERECSDEGLRLSLQLADLLRIRTVLEDITPILEAAGCYRRRDEAIRKLVPDFGGKHKCKLVMAEIASGARYALPSLVVETSNGGLHKVRLTAEVYWEVVAASNFKQRIRKMLEYHHADRLQYAVAGTPNRLEYDQGFFVKNGDGAADLKPIAHLYKSQVYELAEYLGLPAEIRERPSTTDTFSMSQSQEEFYFSVPLRTLDLCLYGKNNGLPYDEVAAAAGLTPDEAKAVCDSIDAKRKATAYLHQPPLLIEPVHEIHCGSHSK